MRANENNSVHMRSIFHVSTNGSIYRIVEILKIYGIQVYFERI